MHSIHSVHGHPTQCLEALLKIQQEHALPSSVQKPMQYQLTPYAVLSMTGCPTFPFGGSPMACPSSFTGSPVSASCCAAACVWTGGSSANVSMGDAPLLGPSALGPTAADASPTASSPAASAPAAPCASAAPLPLGTCKNVGKAHRKQGLPIAVLSLLCDNAQLMAMSCHQDVLC